MIFRACGSMEHCFSLLVRAIPAKLGSILHRVKLAQIVLRFLRSELTGAALTNYRFLLGINAGESRVLNPRCAPMDDLADVSTFLSFEQRYLE